MTVRSVSEPSGRRAAAQARAAIALAPLLFFALAAVSGFRRPGLQYDEALFEHGTVQMLTSGEEPPFVHDPGSWVEIGGRFWPLMVIPYIGAGPHYLLLPVFAVAGPDPAAARAANAALAALGIAGIGFAASRWAGSGAAAAVALLVAIHPGLLFSAVYDNNAIALWTACLGLLALGVARYARRRDAASAFCAGMAAGLGAWCRLNFVWLVIALAVALVVVYGRAALPSWRAAASLVAGGLVGALPLVVFESLSGFATLRFIGSHGTHSPARFLSDRFRLFSESLLCDGYRESIWGGGGVPGWQRAFVTIVVLGSILLLLWPGRRPPDAAERAGRVGALTVVGYLAFAFSTRLGVAAHHLVPLVPVEAFVVAVAGRRLFRRVRGSGAILAAAGTVYAVLALAVIARAASGLRATGGVGAWSDAIDRVADVLRTRYPRRMVYLLDWGFENNLFVISGGSIASKELSLGSPDASNRAGGYSGAPPDPEAVYVVRRWSPEDGPGTPLAGFEEAMARAKPPFQRTRVFQGNGEPYADVFAIPGRDPAPPRITGVFPERIVAGFGFNVQPSGRSAIAVRGSGFLAADVLCWNGRPLATTFGGPALMSAEVPARLFAEPGTAGITIRRGTRTVPGADARLPILARPR